MSVDAVVYYRVSNATVSVANVENAHHSTRLLAQTTLRNILGTKSLHEILSDRESISSSMQVDRRILKITIVPFLKNFMLKGVGSESAFECCTKTDLDIKGSQKVEIKAFIIS